MKTLFRVNDHRADDGWAEVFGLTTPVPGLALTEPVANEVTDDAAHFGGPHVVVTHLVTGKTIGRFRDAESAAAFVLAVAGLCDWTLDAEGILRSAGRGVIAEARTLAELHGALDW